MGAVQLPDQPNGVLENETTIQSEEVEIAMVLGASVYANRYVSLALQKRLDAALLLYQNKKIKTILVSGDNRRPEYNEPLVMKNYLQERGVASQDIVQDFAGLRTLDSCLRAKTVFGVKKMFVITQDFHLPRTVWLCRQIGLQIWPVVAGKSTTETQIWGWFREIGSSWLALKEIYLGYDQAIGSNGEEPSLE